MGRPSGYRDEIATTICERIAAGESLASIGRDESMPAATVIYRWLNVNSSFRDSYAQARESQMEFYSNQIIDIADDAENDYVETIDGPRLNPENVQRSRLKIDARKWIMAHLMPKKYGDQIKIDGRLEVVPRLIVKSVIDEIEGETEPPSP